jgi:large subunit ribosomal protein L9
MLERAYKMKVLLVKDVYKLGRAGDIKKVADGFGRNFLIPQGFAVLATEGAMKQIQKIKSQAEIRRASQNNELSGLADQIKAVTLSFPAKAGDTGKLYGSITTQDIATALSEQVRFEVKRQQVDIQPIRTLGEFSAHIWSPRSRSLFTAKVKLLKAPQSQPKLKNQRRAAVRQKKKWWLKNPPLLQPNKTKSHHRRKSVMFVIQ